MFLLVHVGNRRDVIDFDVGILLRRGLLPTFLLWSGSRGGCRVVTLLAPIHVRRRNEEEEGERRGRGTSAPRITTVAWLAHFGQGRRVSSLTTGADDGWG
jgi:hypothetical protein